ncbi:MAG: hypothetical protein RJA69_2048, partial [Pseudomonadota bacterium]
MSFEKSASDPDFVTPILQSTIWIRRPFFLAWFYDQFRRTAVPQVPGPKSAIQRP